MTRERGITLSPKHGVNPAMCVCPICFEPNNELALLGRYKTPDNNDAEAPRYVIGHGLCDVCKARKADGFIPLICAYKETGQRTGEVAWMKLEALRLLVLDDKALERIAATGAAWITPDQLQWLKDHTEKGGSDVSNEGA